MQTGILNYGTPEERREFQELQDNVKVLESLARDRKREQLNRELDLEDQRFLQLCRSWYRRNTENVLAQLDSLVDHTFRCSVETRDPGPRRYCEKEELRITLSYTALTAGTREIEARHYSEALNAIRSARLSVCHSSERLGLPRDESACQKALADYHNRLFLNP